MTARGVAFVVIGAMGFGVQIAVLSAAVTAAHVAYPLAVALGVEAAVVHNFIWHERWTWADRTGATDILGRLVRFHASNGLCSVIGNVIATTIAVERLRLPLIAANACAVAATSVVNFVLADRWVFARRLGVAAVCLSLGGSGTASAADPKSDTLAAWDAHITAVERSLVNDRQHPSSDLPSGRTIEVAGGAIHEWRGTVRIPGLTVAALLDALQTPGLPPPSDDILESRVLGRTANTVRVFMKLTRSTIVTVTYDTEHVVTFERPEPGLARSRSVATMIRETNGTDRGFLWRLNSYWWYQQDGDDVIVCLLSESLSRPVPVLARPFAGPIVDRIARDSVMRTLEAVRRFGERLSGG
jgi:putative flippase GtrA